MRAIPVIRCSDIKRALAFYTCVLDFEKKYPVASDSDWVIDLVQGGVEIQLSQHAGDGAFGYAINLRAQDVDRLFAKYVARGLETSGHEDSPVHRGPWIRHGASASSM
ncbi:MAG TPA: glyoxalase superfamily protein [Terracidiphilus sp.]|nr:glyoxalase superfamily protein [Terracidiphilus sp.]